LRTEEIVYARPPIRPPTYLNLITSFFLRKTWLKIVNDKYAFLMPDGQDKPLASNKESEKIPDKILKYNLSYLKGIIKGEIPDSQQP
jgi:hypothetical protein